MQPQNNGYWQPQDPAQPLNQPPAPQQPEINEQINIDEPLVQWQASEDIHHEKDGLWFLGAAAILLALGILAVVFRQWTFVGLLVVMAITLAVYTRRPPRVLNFALFSNGLTIDDRHYDYSNFKAFGVRQEGGFYSVVLLPLQRFAPAANLFFDPAQGEQIVDILGAHLPMQPVEPDLLDKLVRKLRL